MNKTEYTFLKVFIQHCQLLYGLTITYQYTVDGKSYTSSRITALGNYESIYYRKIKTIKDKLEAAKTVQVFYNPKNPAVSVLIREPSNQPVAFWYISLIPTLGSGIVIIINKISK